MGDLVRGLVIWAALPRDFGPGVETLFLASAAVSTTSSASSSEEISMTLVERALVEDVVDTELTLPVSSESDSSESKVPGNKKQLEADN